MDPISALTLIASVVTLVDFSDIVSRLTDVAHNVDAAEAECRRLIQEINELQATLKTLEAIGLDKLNEQDAHALGQILKQSQSSITALLDLGDLLAEPKCKDNWFIRWRKKRKRSELLKFALCKLEARMMPAKKDAEVLLESVRKRFSASESSHTTDVLLHEEPALPMRNLELRVQDSGKASVHFGVRGCVLIIAVFVIFTLLSCFLGVYFTVNKGYGYGMGDAFTLAGYVIAVGALVSTAGSAYHYPRCACWKKTKQEIERAIELERLVSSSERRT